MQIVFTLLVRNEEDVIGASLDYHFAQGADHVIVTDNASEDSTRRIVVSHRYASRIVLLSEQSTTHDQSVWVTRMAKIAATELNADWVVHLDADEFWWPESGTIKSNLEAVPKSISRLRCRRRNFLPDATSESSDAPVFFDRLLVREACSLGATGLLLPHKVCHRGNPFAVVADGNHSVTIPGDKRESRDYPDISIFHFPMRSYSQFERKIRLGAEALARNPRLSSKTGSTWRHLYDTYYRPGLLKDYYFKLVPSENDINVGLNSGRLVRDVRLREFMKLL